MSSEGPDRALAQQFFRGAVRKAYAAFKEGRLSPSPWDWIRLLRLHYQELSDPRGIRQTPAGPQGGAISLDSASVPAAASPSAEERTRAGVDRILLDEWLAAGGRLRFSCDTRPLVSVIVVLHNRAELTLCCLRALRTASLSLDIVLVDNASTDDTARLLDRIDGVVIVRNATNVGFLEAVNQGAQRARGELLLLLNSDAEVLPGSLEFAVDTLQRASDIGGVVGKLVHRDGRLQEAGSIVWSDGTCQGYGRGDNPLAPAYMFRRPVDFGSGAFLLTRRRLFLEHGGFDERFKPAYYEDADYCLRLWQSGLRVLYEPRAVAIHVEFASSPSADVAVALQTERRTLFVRKHGAWLRSHAWPVGTDVLLARCRAPLGRRLLFIEDRVPHDKLGSGYPRSRALVDAALELGHEVTLYPLLEASESWEEAFSDIQREVELMLGYGQARLAAFLKERLRTYDTVIVSRPHNMRDVKPVLQDLPPSEMPPLIYDAEALFALREIGRQQQAGVPLSGEQASRMISEELALARGCDGILTVSRAEGERFRREGFTNVETLGNCVVPRPTRRLFAERSGFFFSGAFVDDAAPNTDAIWWFVREVLPRIRGALGSVQLTVAGRGRPDRLAALSDRSVTLLGLVDDLRPLYDQARVFIAPTRFGAGIPIKVHLAAAAGVPVVCTRLVAEQLEWRDLHEVLVADTADEFADRCCRLYTDEELWTRLRNAALRRVTEDCSPEAFRGVLARSLDAARAAAGRRVRRGAGYDATSGVGPYTDAGSSQGLANGSR